MGKRLGRKRLFALNKLGESSGLQAGTGVSACVASSTILRDGHLITTEITLDLGNAEDPVSSAGIAGLIIGTSGSDAGVLVANSAVLGQITTAKNGIITAAECVCVELPTGTGVRRDIDFIYQNDAADGYSGSATSPVNLITAGGNWALGQNITGDIEDAGGQDKYIYMAVGSATDSLATSLYTGGKFVLRLYGYAVPDDQ